MAADGETRVAAPEVPVPVTTREIVSPPAVNERFVLDTAAVAGAKRTVMVAVAPDPPRLNGLPDTMLNGGLTDALPETGELRAFDTVKV